MNRVKESISESIQIGFAIFLASIGLKMFLLPNGFLDGGVTGISILISRVYDVDISIILPLISIPFFIIGIITLDRKIIIKSLLSICCLAIIIHYENFEPITEDKLIIATFGGLFLGAGIGLAIRNGAVLDGAEILGIYINKEFGLSIGAILLIFNILIFGITALVLSPEIAMYSILTYIVTGKAVDFTIQGFENYVGLMIVSIKSQKLQEALLEDIGHGITVYQGGKGYGKRGFTENREIIHVVINRIDLRRIHKMINKIDESAFITEFDVNNVKGGKLRRFLTDKT